MNDLNKTIQDFDQQFNANTGEYQDVPADAYLETLAEHLHREGYRKAPADDATVVEFVRASLKFDYTSEYEGQGYDSEYEELAAALANVREMHRLINVGHERLFRAHEEIAKLRARLGGES